MAEKLITRSHESTWSDERKKNFTNHLVLPVGALALGTALVGGAVGAGEHIFHKEKVGSTIEFVPAGGTPIGTVETGVHHIAEQYGIDEDNVNDVTSAGQEVAGELGQPVQPGAAIEVTVSRNGLGQLSVSADPANLAHLDK